MRGNRRHIPKEKKDLIVVMANHRTPQELADITYISDRTIRRILRNWRRTGSTVKVPIQSGRPRVLTALDVNFLEGLVRRTPDIYTWELRRALFLQTGLEVSKGTIRNALIRRGWTRKTISRSALEAQEDKRLGYQAEVSQHPARRLVFLDEAACNRHTSKRLKAWAPVGERASRLDYFIRGVRYNVLPAISLDGVLHHFRLP